MIGSMEMPLNDLDMTVMDSQENGGAVPKKVKKPKNQRGKDTTYNLNAKDAMYVSFQRTTEFVRLLNIFENVS